ncbi:MAG: isoprenylcysteine carboxylmethyltransferase family protein, partial [Anaerolineae bacterium]|nr:isoprenylcysteine carboxylmethyltransferase family protein [Anaerolineae bacterium]
MTENTSELRKDREPLYGPGDFLKVIVTLAILVGAMALLAGRWDWMAGWTFLGVFTVYSLALFGWLSNVDPELARERQQDDDDRNQPYERVIIPLMVILELNLLVVATVDSGRFGWSTVPVWARVAGWALLAVAGAVLPWVFHTNTFASGVGRIQDDREHHVITNGPYRYVRHPMYTGVIAGFIGLPLALGSWWALIPGGLLIVTFIYRTWQED